MNIKFSNSAFTLKEEIVVIMFFIQRKHDYHDFFLERESTRSFSLNLKRVKMVEKIKSSELAVIKHD